MRGEPTPAPPIVRRALAGPGAPLPEILGAMARTRLPIDASRVRVHTDALAARSADAVHADAYTVGRHIAFAAGRYQPGTPAGRRLLMHELTHVAEQGAAEVPALGLRIDAAHESAAERCEAGDRPTPRRVAVGVQCRRKDPVAEGRERLLALAREGLAATNRIGDELAESRAAIEARAARRREEEQQEAERVRLALGRRLEAQEFERTLERLPVPFSVKLFFRSAAAFATYTRSCIGIGLTGSAGSLVALGLTGGVVFGPDNTAALFGTTASLAGVVLGAGGAVQVAFVPGTLSNFEGDFDAYTLSIGDGVQVGASLLYSGGVPAGVSYQVGYGVGPLPIGLYREVQRTFLNRGGEVRPTRGTLLRSPFFGG